MNLFQAYYHYVLNARNLASETYLLNKVQQKMMWNMGG